MELAWLEDLVALARLGHFSRAAEARNITQPAFSRRIRTLEDWVGTPLFNRDTHHVTLTKAGEVFKPVAEELLRLAAFGRNNALSAAQTSAETLRFASTHALSVTFFPDWLRLVEDRMSLAAVVSLIADNMAGCERVMLQGEAHFLLCHHHPSAATKLDPKQFRYLDIGEELLVPASVPDVPGGIAARHALPGSPETPVSYLSYSATSGMGRIIEGARALDAPPAWLFTCFSSHVATALVAICLSGRGMAWLPRSLIERHLQSGALVRAGDESWDLPMAIRLVRQRRRLSLAAEQFWAGLPEVSPRQRPAPLGRRRVVHDDKASGQADWAFATRWARGGHCRHG